MSFIHVLIIFATPPKFSYVHLFFSTMKNQIYVKQHTHILASSNLPLHNIHTIQGIKLCKQTSPQKYIQL